MSNKVINTFHDGLNLDVADMMMKNSFLRFAQNVRILNLGGTSYLISNLQGTERKFTISSGFSPIAAEEYNGVLYIISKNETQLEIGSYPSVDPQETGNIWIYRPINNLIGGPTILGVTNAFRLNLEVLGLSGETIIQKLIVQPDYDRTVNLLFTIRGYKPRIINSRFSAIRNQSSLALKYVMREPGANINEYSLDSVEDETSTILYSTKILGIDFSSISSGGKLKPGNYQYVFHYMTEGFNQTNVVGQSSTCQVAFGEIENNRKGGDETQETDKRVILSLSNIDTNFRYLKVYCMYSSGQEATSQQYLEFTHPVQITGETLNFNHTGYEELAEVSADTVNIDYATIESADCSTQAGGFYFFGGIRQRSFDFKEFKIESAKISPTFKSFNLPGSSLPGYADPANVYRYTGGFGDETYPYGIVYIMNDGSLSPVFPTKGVTITSSAGPSVTHNYEPVPGEGKWYKGLVKFPSSNHYLPYDNGVKVKSLEFNLNTIPQSIKDQSVGFFIVRGERMTNLITQGILIPTFKVPVIEDFSTNKDGNNTYWEQRKGDINDTNVFKFLPCLDSLVEAYCMMARDGGNTYAVLDPNNRIQDGYMPIFINDLKNMDSQKGGWTPNSNPEIWYSEQNATWARHWALISGEALLNEPFYVTQLQKDSMGIKQLGKVSFRVKGKPTSLFNIGGFPGHPEPPANNTGLWYEFNSIIPYASAVIRTARRTVFVPGERQETGNDFISYLAATMYYFQFSSISPTQEWFFFVKTMMNSYFGVEMEVDPLKGELTDATKGANNPIGGNARIGNSNLVKAYKSSNSAISPNITSGTMYSNNDKVVNGAFLVNVYASATPGTPDDLYPTIDNISYRQVTKRYAWADLPTNKLIPVFGGDCYIGKIYRKLNQSGERITSLRESDAALRSNIDQGQLVSWWQESKYNLALRQPKLYDESENEERSFFPYESRGDFFKYRSYRYPETVSHSQGYSELLRPKSFFPSPSLAPSIENYFFSRITHSERHIPNAFRNGYRSFLPNNFKDYDSSLGQITGMFNLRGNLLVIFEHGMGITAIEQRVLTGADVAGGVFALPSEVLPPTLTYITREIGCQSHLSLVQTPGAVYGVDESRGKLWKVTPEGIKVISDEGLSSWLISSSPVRPRSGYDLENNEVIFCTDYWTLAYREGLEKFVSFYSFGSSPTLFTRRENELYSFVNNQAWKHNAPVYTIYDEEKEVIVEMVVNDTVATTKVYDYINIISNQVAPLKIELYSYNQDEHVGPVIDVPATNQYTKIDFEDNFFTEEPNIMYRDKKYIAQIPYRLDYNPGTGENNWGAGGRMRDKYMILRLTYKTSESLQLASVITALRLSYS